MSKQLEPVAEDGGYTNPDSAPPGSVEVARNKYEASPGSSIAVRTSTSPVPRSILGNSAGDSKMMSTENSELNLHKNGMSQNIDNHY